MELEELVKKIDANIEKIDGNSKRIEENFKQISQNSCALDILKDYKSDTKRWFIILIIVLFMWFATIGYLVYVLNDIGTIEETVTQENESGYNNDIGNDGEINNGKTNDQD